MGKNWGSTALLSFSPYVKNTQIFHFVLVSMGILCLYRSMFGFTKVWENSLRLIYYILLVKDSKIEKNDYCLVFS